MLFRSAEVLESIGINAKVVRRLNEEHPNIMDVIKHGEVDLVINTPTKANDSKTDGFHMRRAAIERNIGVMTALDTVRALVEVKKNKIEDTEIPVFDLAK